MKQVSRVKKLIMNTYTVCTVLKSIYAPIYFILALKASVHLNKIH